MTKRIWKLYKEVRRLRKQVKFLDQALSDANRRYNELYYRKHPDDHYDTMSIFIPNVHNIARQVGPATIDHPGRIDHLSERVSDSAKLKMFNDLLEQGYVKTVQDDLNGLVMEMRAIKYEHI